MGDVEGDNTDDIEQLGTFVFHFDIRYRYINGGIIERRYSWSPRNPSQFERVLTVIYNQPIYYVRTLIQLGFEPLPPFPTRSIFGTRRIGLPGFFSYLNFLIEKEGYLAVFKGVTYSIIRFCIADYVIIKSRHLANNWYPTPLPEAQKASNNGDIITQPKEYIYTRMIKESLCQIIALTVSYPFTLLVKRTFAQFIGQDTIYYSFSLAVSDIYQNEGLAGFYAGFVPHLIQDIIIFWASRHLLMLVPGYKLNPEDSTGFGVAFTSFLLQPFLYSFQLVSTVMAVNPCTSLEASRIYPRFSDWKECWSHLQSLNHLKRGSSLIWRYHF